MKSEVVNNINQLVIKVCLRIEYRKVLIPSGRALFTLVVLAESPSHRSPAACMWQAMVMTFMDTIDYHDDYLKKQLKQINRLEQEMKANEREYHSL